MRRSTTSVLALGLAGCLLAGGASAQSYGGYGTTTYRDQPSVDRYGQSEGAYYDYARVLRVDPVLSGGRYPVSSSQRCYTRTQGYAGNDGYYGNGGYGNDPYRNDPYGNDPYRNDPYRSGGYYGNQGYGNDGYGNTGYGSASGRTLATVIGGVVGAAIGSQVGGGSARYATSAIGSMVGGIAGRQVYENAQRNRAPAGTVRVCDPVPVTGSGDGRYYGASNGAVNAYDVTYEYAGRQYTTRTSYNPGSRIRVRVDVRPD